MNLWFPRIERRRLGTMLGIALVGGLVGGVYGIFHDLGTFAISPEYFTKMKFGQFAWANRGWPPQVFAAEIGFIATGAVGMMAGWFLARTALPIWSWPSAGGKIARGFAMVLGTALLAGGVGCWLGLRHTKDYSHWQEFCMALGVTDVPAFVRVAYIHNAGYIGGFVGLVIAILWLRRAGRIKCSSNDGGAAGSGRNRR